MPFDQVRAKVKSNIWQAIAQSSIDLSSVPADQQNRLVDALTDNLLVTINETLDEVARPVQKKAETAELADDAEISLWEGRPFLSLVEFYTLTNERIKISRGMIGKDIENYELIRIQDIDVTQNVGERMLGLGDITIHGADSSDSAIILRNIKDPNGVYEILRKAWLAARKKYGLQFREMM